MLTIEQGMIYNRDLIFPPETERFVIKCVHNDIHGEVGATQKR